MRRGRMLAVNGGVEGSLTRRKKREAEEKQDLGRTAGEGRERVM